MDASASAVAWSGAYTAAGSTARTPFSTVVPGGIWFAGPLQQAIAAFGAGDFDRTVDLLLPVRYDIRRIGGSHAQRDLFNQTLIAAALGAGRRKLARALLAERLALKPNSRRTQRAYQDVSASA